MPKRKQPSDVVLEALRSFGLQYPGAHTKCPWEGHLDLAVQDKTFAYLSVEGAPFKVSCKLPQSAGTALMLPFAKPTGYGLGKSGWVTAEFSAGETPPLALFKQWVDESYRAQAPKRLVASLPPGLPGAGAKPGKSPLGKAMKAGAVTKSRAPAARKATPAARKKATRR